MKVHSNNDGKGSWSETALDLINEELTKLLDKSYGYTLYKKEVDRRYYKKNDLVISIHYTVRDDITIDFGTLDQNCYEFSSLDSVIYETEEVSVANQIIERSRKWCYDEENYNECLIENVRKQIEISYRYFKNYF